MSSRRKTLSGYRHPLQNRYTHTGLWFDKFLSTQDDSQEIDDKKPRTALVDQTTHIQEAVDYKAYFDRWKASLFEMGIKPYFASVKGRMSIGLGGASVIETAVSIHRTYGIPYIPGSALKGTASTYAHQHLEGWAKKGEAHETLFGTTESAGFVTFFDALPEPGSWKLHVDTITVHHPDYYQGTEAAPADWDSPNPIPFLSVTGKFLIALHAPDAPAWADIGIDILRLALDELGVGAKTSSGYGRLLLFADPEQPPMELKEGVYIRCKITEVHPDGLYAKLHRSMLRQLDTDKKIDIYVPSNYFGDIVYQEGHGIRCIILSKDYEDEREIFLVCRPATAAERREHEG